VAFAACGLMSVERLKKGHTDLRIMLRKVMTHPDPELKQINTIFTKNKLSLLTQLLQSNRAWLLETLQDYPQGHQVTRTYPLQKMIICSHLEELGLPDGS
jgi:hypothetical protein